MPELPEVETVRRGLEPAMLGAHIDNVEARRADIRFPFPPRFRERLTGKRVVELARRGKFLLFRLDSGETLIAHLGMSGSFRVEAEAPLGAFNYDRSKDPSHDHVVFHLDTGKIVTYNDPRRFGFMDLAKEGALDAHPRLAGLGVEPLSPEFGAACLARLFANSRAPLKSALLDQRRIAGLGNIYVCEALFRARLAPSRPANVLANARGGPAFFRCLRPGGAGLRSAPMPRNDPPRPALWPLNLLLLPLPEVAPEAAPCGPFSLTREQAPPISRTILRGARTGRFALCRAFCCRRRPHLQHPRGSVRS